MDLVELMEIWALKTDKTPIEYLYTIFDDAALDVRIERPTLALELINECGTMTPRFMDTSFFATMAANFFKVKEREIKRDLDALETQYDPFDDYHMEKDGNSTKTHVVDETHVRTDNLTETTIDGDITNTHLVSADNETDFVHRSRDVTSTEDDSTTHTGTQTHKDDATNTETEYRHDTEHGRHKAGQEFLSAELEANKNNIYRLIALDFATNMCICVS